MLPERVPKMCMRDMMKAILYTMALLAISSNTNAKDLYVSPTGDDSVAYSANSISSPWKTLDYSLYSLQAGDTLNIRGGAYKQSSVISMKLKGKSGTADKPVVVTGYQDEKVVIDVGIPKMFVDLDNKSYWTFKNLEIINSGAAFRVGYDVTSYHNTFENLIIRASYGGDNSANIQLISGRADYTVIKNNILQGPGVGSGIHLNTGVIFAKTVNHLRIENNEIYNAPIGIYFKHSNDQFNSSGAIDIQIKNNYIHDTSRNSMQLNSNYAQIVNNLLGRNNSSILVNDANGDPGGDYNTFRKNTFFSGNLVLSSQTQGGDQVPGAIGNKLFNNLFVKAPVYAHRYSSVLHQTVSNYNYYPSPVAYKENRVDYSLSAWKTHSGQDVNSVTGQVIFVGGSTPDSIPGFVLGPSSAGYKAGSDGKDMGADVSLVGPASSTTTRSLPIQQQSPPNPPDLL